MVITLNDEEIQQAIREYLEKRCNDTIVTSFRYVVTRRTGHDIEAMDIICYTKDKEI